MDMDIKASDVAFRLQQLLGAVRYIDVFVNNSGVKVELTDQILWEESTNSFEITFCESERTFKVTVERLD